MEYFTVEIIKELESIERDAKRAWDIAWWAEEPSEVNTNNIPSWFKRPDKEKPSLRGS